MLINRFIKNKIFQVKFGRLLKKISITNIDSLSGVEFEEFVANYFKYLGYDALKTRTTGDNGIDIIAAQGDTTLGVQAKLYYGHNISNSAVQEAYSGCRYYKCSVAIVVTNWHFSKPATNLARELKVGLIDREKLSGMLKCSKRESIKIIREIIENANAI